MRLGQIGVRRAGNEDAGRIAGVHDAAWRLAYRGIIPGRDLERMIARRGPLWWKRAIERHTSILVLDVGGEVVGYATIGPNRMRMLPFAGEIYEIYLLPEHQGLGFGRLLFEAARRELRRYGLASFSVRVLADNLGARGFYEHMGGAVAAETGERIGETTLPLVVFGFPAT
ncbi:GNAT family N-acetyltransferase [Siculibacillus lacustris]|uniref:GNAT family N-acetyltransferase n=1 Tax=Siculibacillus lacustris TaxID=1549641 RepID=A0A4Q9VW70_9HYPH|nr:GNAT family N-acetyltransferase [Siculibacillus lacustris]TBW40073.1 GNAT family N-acetyltransferase [Siculibacillus lacustris]